MIERFKIELHKCIQTNRDERNKAIESDYSYISSERQKDQSYPHKLTLNQEQALREKKSGATEKEIFWRITFPQLVPTIAFLSTVNLIGAFKVYTQVYALFGGTAGVANSATTAVYYIYDKFHVAGRPGIAMAATVILFVIILIATFFQNKFLRRAEG